MGAFGRGAELQPGMVYSAPGSRSQRWPVTPGESCPNMFFAGIRHSDRVRGAGWLDCPNCHEHAAQDVVDEMSFVALLFYRFFPVRRRRVLVCRKCGYRRPATSDQMASLETSGKPIHRA